MSKTKKITITIVGIFLLISLVVILWFLRPFILERIQVSGSRPEEAYLIPDFSGEVTDVRVTVVSRDIDAHAIYGDTFEKDGKVYQLYYGYEVDGEWVDIPHENYDLRGLKNKKKSGFDAANNDHLVVIGPYVMIALSGKGDAEDTIVDTEKTEVFSITEYYSSEPPSYFFTENRTTFDSWDCKTWMGVSFHRWHFILLNSEDISENYSVTISSHSKENSDLLDERTYTYEDIMNVLGND